MTYKNRMIFAGTLTGLFLLLLILVKTVDVAPIGPNGTKIGLSTMNGAVHEGIGIHLGWYHLTEVFGILAILTAGGIAIIGLLQWITRKNLLKVDAEILTSGLLFAAAILLYFLFEKAVINYRPVIMPGETEPEASFPSSHTFLIITVMGCVFMLSSKYAPDGIIRIGIKAVCAIIILLTIIGRLVSGVHWISDIIAGVLLGTALLDWFRIALAWTKKLLRTLRNRRKS